MKAVAAILAAAAPLALLCTFSRKDSPAMAYHVTSRTSIRSPFTDKDDRPLAYWSFVASERGIEIMVDASTLPDCHIFRTAATLENETIRLRTWREEIPAAQCTGVFISRLEKRLYVLRPGFYRLVWNVDGQRFHDEQVSINY